MELDGTCVCVCVCEGVCVCSNLPVKGLNFTNDLTMPPGAGLPR